MLKKAKKAIFYRCFDPFLRPTFELILRFGELVESVDRVRAAFLL
jgi:hypothetical protein